MHPTSHTSLHHRKGRHRGRHGDLRRPSKTTPTVCWECRAVLVRGRWTWKARLKVPADICLPPVLCPACRRIRDGEPVHVVRIDGLSNALARELRALAARAEDAERATHPQERVVPVAAGTDTLAIGTTGMHLARRLVASILRTRKHEVEVVRRNDVETSLRWRRPEDRAG